MHDARPPAVSPRHGLNGEDATRAQWARCVECGTFVHWHPANDVATASTTTWPGQWRHLPPRDRAGVRATR